MAADKDIDIGNSKKILPNHVLGIMQKYTLMPGKMIQTCRKVIEFIQNKLIPESNACICQDLLRKVDEQNLIELDRTGGVLLLYDYLKASVDYYFAYSQSFTPMNNISLLSTSGNKLVEFDEALEMSAEILKKSFKDITPPRSRFRIKSEAKEFVTQNSVSKSESTRSIQTKDLYESLLEEQFKAFLKGKNFEEYPSVLSRIQLIDQFELEIRHEIRENLLEKVLDSAVFEELRSQL